jgi:DNA transposition AAA+ family ATPase
MFDEVHLLSWESLELIRTIHDAAHVGVVFCGQERFYEQMRGSRRSYLYDQFSSRISCLCRLTSIEKKDVRMLCEAIYPNLDNKCLEFLFSKASGPGKFRVMTKILKRAVFIAEKEKVSVTLDLLKEANSLLFL